MLLFHLRQKWHKTQVSEAACDGSAQPDGGKDNASHLRSDAAVIQQQHVIWHALQALHNSTRMLHRDDAGLVSAARTLAGARPRAPSNALSRLRSCRLSAACGRAAEPVTVAVSVELWSEAIGHNDCWELRSGVSDHDGV